MAPLHVWLCVWFHSASVLVGVWPKVDLQASFTACQAGKHLSHSKQSQWNLIWTYAELHTSPIGWIEYVYLNAKRFPTKWKMEFEPFSFVFREYPHHRKCTLNFYLRVSFSYWKRSSNFYFRFPFSLGFVQQNCNCHFRFFSRTHSLTSNMTSCTVLIRNRHSLLDTMITAKPFYTSQTTDSGNDSWWKRIDIDLKAFSWRGTQK